MSAARDKFERRAEAARSLLCVGLDPEFERIPERFKNEEWPLFAFNRWIIEQTHLYAASYKPNMAFYEARGTQGLRELELTIEYLRGEHPDLSARLTRDSCPDSCPKDRLPVYFLSAVRKSG